MNNRTKSETLIFEIFQVTSPEDFLTMDIESIFNKIENTNHAHIHMLKGYISPELFDKITTTIASMFSVDNTPDLERSKKLLQIKCFEGCLTLYFDRIVKENLINLNIPYIRDNTPQELYKIFIDKYLKNEDCWRYFLKTTQYIEKEEILELFYSGSGTLEKHLLLINVPNSMVEYLNDKLYHVVSEMWRTKDKPDYGYCKECMKTKDEISKRTEASPLSSDELFHQYLPDLRYWCHGCLYEPLLTIMTDFSSYENTQYIGNYENLSNNW